MVPLEDHNKGTVIFLDTNVLIYASDVTSRHHKWAREMIVTEVSSDGAMINPVVLAELCVGESAPDKAADTIRAWGVEIVDLPGACAERCAAAYSAYSKVRKQRAAEPAPRIPLPDFFIGAHASILKIPLCTADARRYQTYFPELELRTPKRTKQN